DRVHYENFEKTFDQALKIAQSSTFEGGLALKGGASALWAEHMANLYKPTEIEELVKKHEINLSVALRNVGEMQKGRALGNLLSQGSELTLEQVRSLSDAPKHLRLDLASEQLKKAGLLGAYEQLGDAYRDTLEKSHRTGTPQRSPAGEPKYSREDLRKKLETL